jgi:hypothetical protein
MNKSNWFGAVVALLFLFCALTSRSGYGEGFDRPPQNDGRALSPEEFRIVEDCIESLGTPPPDSIKYIDQHGNWHTVSLSSVGLDLVTQLYDGRTGAEQNDDGRSWALPDCMQSTNGDQMNVSPSQIAKAGNNPDEHEVLEGQLIHEWTHKTQDTLTLTEPGNQWGAEIGPYQAQMAYLCSLGLPWGDPRRRGVSRLLGENEAGWEASQEGEDHLVRPPVERADGSYCVSLNFDSTAAGSDSLESYQPGDEEYYVYPLAPTRASDLMIFQDCAFLPPGHSLALICGGEPPMGVGRILALDLYAGEVVATYASADFGPPTHPPMFFYSMSRSVETGTYFVLDTMLHNVYTMTDLDGNLVPDEISGVFASAAWPGFEPLVDQHGVDETFHPFLGAGLMLTAYDAHPADLLNPPREHYFLPDADGNDMADGMLLLPLKEFLSITPIIQVPRPMPGDNFLLLFASWEHDVTVWSTDSTGELMIESLGMVHIAPGNYATCPLIRPLENGEYIVPRDTQNGKHPAPILVTMPAPQHLVISVGPGDGIIFLHWDPVPGAIEYAIWMSNDGVEFFDSGMRTPINQFAIPPANKQFFEVRAIR